MGLARLEVKNADGEILADWGKNLKGPNIKIENGKRNSTIYDFRNRPKFLISAETGTPEMAAPKPETSERTSPLPLQTEHSEILKALPSKEKPEPAPDILPIDKLNKEEKCVALTQWLGQSLDVQVSALGIFDGSRFEWKAWADDSLWKYSPRTTPRTQSFISTWIDLVRAPSYNETKGDQTLKARELALKGYGRARLSDKSRAQKQEALTGIGLTDKGTVSFLNYRWRTVRTLLTDIQLGLRRDA